MNKTFLITKWKATLSAHTDQILCLALGALSLAIYLRTCAPSLLEEGDPNELAMVSYVLGISHPTGYPLFTLLGHLFTTLLPWADVAGRLTLMSALLAAGAVPIVYLLARQLGAGPFGATLGAAVLAFCQAFWSIGVRGDVHGLNALFMALSTWLLLRWGQTVQSAPASSPDAWRDSLPYLVACAFVCGLSITNHITTYLLVPGFLVFFLMLGRPFWRHPTRLVLPILAFLVPLLLYLYIPIRGNQLMADPLLAQDPAGIGIPLRITWGITSPHYRNGGWEGFVNLVFAGDYVSVLLSVPWTEAPSRLSILPDILQRQLGLGGIALAILGFAALARRQPRSATMLCIIWLTMVTQITRYSEQNMTIFLIPAYLVMVACMGVGIQGVLHNMERCFHGRARAVGRIGLVAAFLLLPIGQLVGNYSVVDRSQDWAIPQFTQEVLDRNLPQGAVLLGNGDVIVPLRYRQTVDGQRRDLIPIHVGFGTSWFYDIIEQCRQQARPVYIIQPFPDEERDTAPTRYPQKITPLPLYGEVKPQYLAYTNIADQVALLGYDLQPETLRLGGALHVNFYWQALRDLQTDYRFFVRLITPDSHTANHIERSPVSPWFPTSHWREGQVFLEEVHMLIPANTPPGVYNLEVAWKQGDQLLPLLRQGGRVEVAPIVLRQMTVIP